VPPPYTPWENLLIKIILLALLLAAFALALYLPLG